MKIGIFYSGFMTEYLEDFLKICEKNNDVVNIFSSWNFETKSRVDKIFKLKTLWKPKKSETILSIEKEISELVNIDDFDYFICDVEGFSFKNTCIMFHSHTKKYRIEHNYNALYGLLLKISHLKRITFENNHYRNVKIAVVGSNEMKNDYCKNANIPTEVVKIIPPGINNKKDVVIKDKKSDAFVIGGITCGFITKGGYNILNAIKVLKKEYSPNELKCRIINPGYDKQWWLKLYVWIFGLDKYVEFLPYFKDINEFYKSIDCLICASRHEPFGRIVPEGMSVGVPVICGSNIGAQDIIQDGVNGYVFGTGKNKYKNLAEAVKKAMENANNNSELIKNAKNTSKVLTWENFAQNIYDALISNNKGV